MNGRYLRGYYNIIEYAKRKDRKKGEGIYFEKHHIVPSAFGGSNRLDNLVLLTAKEHFIAHYLLTKFTKGTLKKKAWKAFGSFMMDRYGNRSIRTPRLFEKARTAKSLAMKGENNPMYGRKHSQESKDAMSVSHKGLLVGSQNGWHHSNRTEEELKERAKKAAETRIKKWNALSIEEQEEIRKEKSTLGKKVWKNLDDSVKQNCLGALRYWEYKTVEELKKINEKKGHKGTENGRASVYILSSPEGRQFQVEMDKGLKLFCEENNLVFRALYKIRKTGGTVKSPTSGDTKMITDEVYKYNRINTIGWTIEQKRINQCN